MEFVLVAGHISKSPTRTTVSDKQEFESGSGGYSLQFLTQSGYDAEMQIRSANATRFQFNPILFTENRGKDRYGFPARMHRCFEFAAKKAGQEQPRLREGQIFFERFKLPQTHLRWLQV